MKMLEMGQFVVSKLETIKPGQFDAIIFDTWARTEQALRYWGKAHAAEFREASTFSMMGKMKNGEEWKEGDRYTARVINEMASKAKFVGLITHLKEQNIAGAKTGKLIPDGSKILDTACNFRVWLRKNPNSGVPIALVLKRLAEDTVNKQGYLETVNIMPWKLTPLDDHKSVWDTIDWYRANPFGNRSPESHETPDNFEMSILTGIMTNEQRQIWEANLRERQLMDKEEVAMESNKLIEQQSLALKLKAEGVDLSGVVEKLADVWGVDGVDLGMVMKWME